MWRVWLVSAERCQSGVLRMEGITHKIPCNDLAKLNTPIGLSLSLFVNRQKIIRTRKD